MTAGAKQLTVLTGNELINVVGTGSVYTEYTVSGLTSFKKIANTLTASTTQTLAGGKALIYGLNRATTVANAGDAFTLPAAVVGQEVILFNAGANACAVFPDASGSTIDGGTAGASVTLTNALRCRYICIAAGTWISSQLGAVSA